MHDVRRRWGNVFWRSWARVIRARLPTIEVPTSIPDAVCDTHTHTHTRTHTHTHTD